MGPPITPNSKSFAAFSAHEGLDSMLSLVMSLEGPKIFEWLCSWMINVVLAFRCTTIARKSKHCCWLSSSQRLWPLSILRSMPPHMHLQRLIFGATSSSSFNTKTVQKGCGENHSFTHSHSHVKYLEPSIQSKSLTVKSHSLQTLSLFVALHVTLLRLRIIFPNRPRF